MALEGTFQDMSLPDLFQVFCMGNKSGVLILSRDFERGIIYVHLGRLIDAVVLRCQDRHLLASSEEAVLRLLGWDAAEFIFRHDLQVADRPTRIMHDSEWLVLEGMRRREYPLPSHQQITLDSQLEMAGTPRAVESGVNLDLDQWRVLSHIVLRSTLKDVCAHIGIEPQHVIRIAAELIAIGLIQVVTPSPRPSAPSRTPSAHALSALVPAVRAPDAQVALPAPDTSGARRALLNAVMRRVRGL